MNDEISSLTDQQLVERCVELGLPKIPVSFGTRKLIEKKIRDELEKRNQSLPLATSPKSTSTPKQQHRSMAASAAPATASVVNKKSSSIGNKKKSVAATNGDQYSYNESNGKDFTDNSATPGNSMPEPMEIDPYPSGDGADTRPVEPPSKKRPVFASTTRNSPLLKPVVAAADQNDVVERQEQSPTRYLSEFGRRLSKMPATSSTNQLFLSRDRYDNLIKDSADTRQPHARILNSTLKAPANRNTKLYEMKMHSSATKKTPNCWPWSNATSTSNLVSFSLLMLVVAFFAFIVAKYFDIVKSSSSTSSIDDIYMQKFTSLACIASDENGPSTTNARCILPGEFEATVMAFKKLQDELQRRAVSYMCGLVPETAPFASVADRPFMTFAETKRFLGFQFDVNLINLLLYAWANNDFKIEPIEIIEPLDGEAFKLLENIDDLVDRFETKSKSSYGFVNSNPKLSFSCRMLHYFRSHTKQLLNIAVGLLAVFLVSLIVMFYRNRQRARKDQIRLLTQKTIEMLQQKDAAKKDGTVQESYLPINHIRDTLIPSEKRIAMEQIWQTVITNLKETESRIRVESRVVAGEEFEVWSWIGSGLHKVVHNLSRGNNGSLWQGQAFETQAGAMNNPQSSPTSCLKVRGMMQKDAVNNHDEIRQNVRNKCESSTCKIIHCAVESDCVYLKCASPGDAAHAYQELHGWWYDGNLITVKYIRDERYNERFSDSANGKV